MELLPRVVEKFRRELNRGEEHIEDYYEEEAEESSQKLFLCDDDTEGEELKCEHAVCEG